MIKDNSPDSIKIPSTIFETPTFIHDKLWNLKLILLVNVRFRFGITPYSSNKKVQFHKLILSNSITRLWVIPFRHQIVRPYQLSDRIGIYSDSVPPPVLINFESPPDELVCVWKRTESSLDKWPLPIMSIPIETPRQFYTTPLNIWGCLLKLLFFGTFPCI